MTLADYLASFRGRRWQPGVFDCGVFMADWVCQVCGRDPIADVRGSYRTEAQFQQILASEGGFLKSCARRMAAVGMRRTRTPHHGDLMVVMAPFDLVGDVIQRRPTGAIGVSKTMRAVITSDRGLVIADDAALPALRAWSFPCLT